MTACQNENDCHAHSVHLCYKYLCFFCFDTAASTWATFVFTFNLNCFCVRIISFSTSSWTIFQKKIRMAQALVENATNIVKEIARPVANFSPSLWGNGLSIFLLILRYRSPYFLWILFLIFIFVPAILSLCMQSLKLFLIFLNMPHN